MSTVRAIDVMTMFRRGQSKKQIADGLKITKERVEKYLVEAMREERDANQRSGPATR